MRWWYKLQFVKQKCRLVDRKSKISYSVEKCMGVREEGGRQRCRKLSKIVQFQRKLVIFLNFWAENLFYLLNLIGVGKCHCFLSAVRLALPNFQQLKPCVCLWQRGSQMETYWSKFVQLFFTNQMCAIAVHACTMTMNDPNLLCC